MALSVRRKLNALQVAFAAFAVVATAATIYGVQWQMRSAVQTFEQSMVSSLEVDRLQFALDKQVVYLRALAGGDNTAFRAFRNAREAFFARLRSVTRYRANFDLVADTAALTALADELESQLDQCISHVRAGDLRRAQALLPGIEDDLVPRLDDMLGQAGNRLADLSKRSTRDLGAASSNIYVMTIMVGALAACLVIVGAMFIRLWLLMPIADLQTAAARFSAGDFDHRVKPRSGDELGRLALALNDMAQRVSDAQLDLAATAGKYRSLFRNLRDAVVICDVAGCIQEYHDSDSRLLGVEGTSHIGRHILDVWPEWATVTPDWSLTLRQAAEGRTLRRMSVELAASDPEAGRIFADFVVYRVDVGETPCAAVVMRDVTDRQRLQRRLRGAETMEAVGTLAGGLAHDFNNLLAAVNGTLSLLAKEIDDDSHADRIRSALRACSQAAGLSRRLLNFATSAHGDPQVFRLSEMVELVIDSLDPSFVEGIELICRLDDETPVRMDRDQFTQVILNLLRNARDAMTDGGTLTIWTESVVAQDADEGTEEQPYTVLAVQDTGVGMTREVQRRMFEPLFSTKPRTARCGRGLGMSIVYSAVKNAGGFIQVHSVPGEGTTFRVHLPPGTAQPGLVEPPSRVVSGAVQGAILVVDEESSAGQAQAAALAGHGREAMCMGVDEALARNEEGRLPQVALAVLDMHAGAGRGVRLAERLVVANPELRIIFTTGSTELPIPPGLARHVWGRYLKPVGLEDLSAAAQAALSAGYPGSSGSRSQSM